MPQRCTAPMSTEQLGQIVEDSASEVYIFDPESYRFLLVNKGARENLGYSSRELAELTPWDIKPEYTEGQFKEMLTPLLSGEQPSLTFETAHERKDGTVYDVSVHLQLIRSENGFVFFAAIRDVTHERRLREMLQTKAEELEAALQTKEFLLKEVNHRVKNSLAVVSSLIRLQARQSDNPELKSALEQAQERIAVVSSIHQRLYTSNEHATVDIGDFLRDIAEKTHKHMDEDGRITLRCETQEGIFLGLERGLPVALVVAEILTNSLKYAFPEGRKGEVVLSVGQENDGITIAVADTGIGMDAISSAPGGTGLGKKIINGLTRQIGAELQLTSGESGTSYRIDVPLAV